MAREKVEVRSEISGDGVRWQRRVIEIADPHHHFDVEETFENPTSEIIGLKIDHFITRDSAETWLGGQKFLSLKDLSVKKSPIDFSDPWNPSVFVQLGLGQGLGLTSNDDVFRQQTRVYHDPFKHRSGLKSDSFCLGPKQSYKVSWSIYDTSPSYWDFIDDAREVRGVNHPVDGSFIWFQPDDILAMDFDFLKTRLQFQNVKTASLIGGWVDPKQKREKGDLPVIGFGTSVLSPEFKSLRVRIQRAVQKLKAARPDIHVLIYFDAQRESLPDTEHRYADSLFLTADRKTESTNWGGRYRQTWSVYPTLTNTFGRALDGVTALVKTLGADGLYWDEMESLDYSEVRQTTSEWDGHTCRLGNREKVVAKIGLVNLLSEKAKEKYAQASGFILANSPPTTEFFSSRPDLHMVENQHLTDYSSYAHLTTPLAYIGSGPDWQHIVAPIDKGLLPTGVRLDYDTAFFAAIYPITVLRIYPGAIFGRDKIVASKNGIYGWKNECQSLKVTEFDDKGRVIATTASAPHRAAVKAPDQSSAEDLRCVRETHIMDGGAVVLERVPPAEPPKKTPAFFYPDTR